MNKRQARIEALKIAANLIYKEVNNPSGLTSNETLDAADDQLKVLRELKAIQTTLENQAYRLENK